MRRIRIDADEQAVLVELSVGGTEIDIDDDLYHQWHEARRELVRIEHEIEELMWAQSPLNKATHEGRA